MRMLREGMCRTARILHAAGATGVQTLHTRPLTIGDGSDETVKFENIDALCDAIARAKVTDNHLGLFSAHQMGTCRMGNDPRSAVCDARGEVFGVRGLYIGDASAFPGSSGVLTRRCSFLPWYHRKMTSHRGRNLQTSGSPIGSPSLGNLHPNRVG